jgi:DNA uptake protein ComE-like DNA-binding protein
VKRFSFSVCRVTVFAALLSPASASNQQEKTMGFRRTANALALCSVALLSSSLAGCGLFSSNDRDQRAREEKTRDEVAKATEKAKPALQEAGREIRKVADEVAEQAHAAVQGAQEGWERGGQKALDLNSASETELVALPGVNRRQARKIIAGRPYREKHDLVSKGILTEEGYAKISDSVTAR